jgi:hypothetical protein
MAHRNGVNLDYIWRGKSVEIAYWKFQRKDLGGVPGSEGFSSLEDAKIKIEA